MTAQVVDAVAAAGAAWLLTYLLHSSVLLGFAWGAARVVRSEAWRETVWRAALLGEDPHRHTAVISVQNAFGEWLNGFPQKEAETLEIISLDSRGGFARAALVTPIGIYDLRALLNLFATRGGFARRRLPL